jgi:mono/diheme cytochrome c family protein
MPSPNLLFLRPSSRPAVPLSEPMIRIAATLSRAVLAITLALLIGACGQADPSGRGAALGGGAAQSGGQTYRVDMDAIFPPGEGRDLVLNNCQNCHTWVPIVVLQMNETEWARNSGEHRGRVEALGDDDFATLYAYVSSTFTPERPVPQLPPALLETWTNY